MKELRKKKDAPIVNKSNSDKDLYRVFRDKWGKVEREIEALQAKSYDKILSSLLKFIQEIDFEDSTNLQTAVLLTGVNQTDHLKQFSTLSGQITNNCNTIITILKSRDCPNLKSAVELLVSGFLHHEDSDESFKKKQLTMTVLEAWYRQHFGSLLNKPSLVVMIADFEQFNTNCIQDLITLLCSYTNRLPLVLIVGVATAFKTLHNVLPSHVTLKLDANVFQAESSTVMMNKILEEVVLTSRSPFHLSKNAFNILIEMFLFYDYSLHSFIKGYKVFMLEHFMSRPLTSAFHNIENVKNLSHEQMEVIRRSCMSFRKLVDASTPEDQVEHLENDDFLKKKLPVLAANVNEHFYYFHCCLRLLVVLLGDLPRNSLGNLVREIYPICMGGHITKLDSYKECFKLLRFSSKDKALDKLNLIIKTIELYLLDKSVAEKQKRSLRADLEKIISSREKIARAGMSPQKAAVKSPAGKVLTPKATNTPDAAKKSITNRLEMMQHLQKGAQNNSARVLTDFEQSLWECLDYLHLMVEKYLRPAYEAPPLHEFFVFSDCSAVKRQILGAPRGDLHTALANSHHYLQCSCCAEAEDERIIPSLPDTSIAYKLHLENNKFINLYDWLQAFAIVTETSADDDEISPEIQ